MKVKVSEQSIKHLVDNDCVDMVVEYIRKLEAENAGLRAEVERLKERNQFLEQIDSYLQDGINIANEERCIQLEAQVERLTKAGDAMALEFQTYFPLINKMALVDEWNAANGGKQP